MKGISTPLLLSALAMVAIAYYIGLTFFYHIVGPRYDPEDYSRTLLWFMFPTLLLLAVASGTGFWKSKTHFVFKAMVAVACLIFPSIALVIDILFVCKFFKECL